MTTTIANPIYDLAFKYLMEDERVVKILLSALLRKQVTQVSTRRNELINVDRDPVSVFRLDYRAVTVDAQGREEHVLIELQKTDLPSDLLRFRQYLGTQYRAEENMVPDTDDPEGKRKHALPMIAIYLLGHRVGSIEEPVLYVTPKAENYDGEAVTQGLPDPFVDSLTHSSIIVQIPLLHGRLRNHLERILNIFDQTRKDTAQGYLLNIDEADYSGDEDQRLIFHRLLTAGASKEMRERMEMEELLFRDYDERGVELLKQRKQLQENEKQLQENEKQLQKQSEQLQEKDSQLQEKACQLQEKNSQLQEKDSQLQEKDSQLQEKDSQLQEKDSQLQEKDSQLQEKDSQLQEKDTQLQEKDTQLQEKNTQLQEKNTQLQEQSEQLRQTIRLLMQASVPAEFIAERLNIGIEAVKRMAGD